MESMCYESDVASGRLWLGHIVNWGFVTCCAVLAADVIQRMRNLSQRADLHRIHQFREDVAARRGDRLQPRSAAAERSALRCWKLRTAST